MYIEKIDMYSSNTYIDALMALNYLTPIVPYRK